MGMGVGNDQLEGISQLARWLGLRTTASGAGDSKQREEDQAKESLTLEYRDQGAHFLHGVRLNECLLLLLDARCLTKVTLGSSIFL